ncbi:hypothetical protein REPUB_Repub15cG0063400 [Reevesia pubescens]
MATNIFIAFLPLVLLAPVAQTLPSPPPLQQPGCVAELVAFSPCLPYVSAPPNNATNFVAPQCCDTFSSAFESGDGYCFCYILRQPLIFGFPLNKTRVASLSSFCMSKNRSSSLDLLCSSGVPALPPLPSTTDSGRLKPSNSESENREISEAYEGYGIKIKLLLVKKSYENYSTGSDNDSSALIYSPPESAVRSPTPPSSSGEQVIVSSATNQIYKHSTWFLHGMMFFLLNYIHF